MKYLSEYIIAVTLLTFFSCSQSPDNVYVEMANEEILAHKAELETSERVQRKLMKEAIAEFKTNNLNSTRQTIFEAVKKNNGYVSSDQEFKSEGRKSNTVVIRVPAANFDKLLDDATQGVEKFERKEIAVKDVTEEFLDIQARLKTKKELEQRYIDLLKQANSVSEILEIEKQAGELRSEIESIEGRLKYLNDRVSLSTLTMTFYESFSNETEFGEKFKDGFINGWSNLIWFFVAVANVWPFILIVIGGFIGFKIYKRRNAS